MITATLVMAFAAVYRLTILVVHDRISEPLRRRVDKRFDSEMASFLVRCPWCMSIWLGPLIIPAVVWPDNRVMFAAYAVLAASAVTGIVATVIDTFHDFGDALDEVTDDDDGDDGQCGRECSEMHTGVPPCVMSPR